MDSIEGEEVARQAEGDRQCTQIAANFWERDRLGRRGVRLAPRSGNRRMDRNVFGGTPNTAVETTALPKHWISEHSRRLASTSGSARLLDIQDWRMQVVDFHDFSGYFSWFLRRPFAVMVLFFKVQNRLM